MSGFGQVHRVRFDHEPNLVKTPYSEHYDSAGGMTEADNFRLAD
jgi:hypothetical protein